MKTLNLLTAEPATPDVGTRFRGGPFALVIAIFYALLAAGGGLVLWGEGLRLLACVAALLFDAAALWVFWNLVGCFRSHAAEQRSHAVLTELVRFDIICTCRNVAATVFFDPDSLAPESGTWVHFFIESDASRQRIVRFRFGPHAAQGPGAAQTASLLLVAGHAVVYLFPLAVASLAVPDVHHLPVTFRVESPTGAGLRLPVGLHHLHDIRTVHFPAPFILSMVSASPPLAAVREPLRYLSFASVSKRALRLEILANVMGTRNTPPWLRVLLKLCRPTHPIPAEIHENAAHSRA